MKTNYKNIIVILFDENKVDQHFSKTKQNIHQQEMKKKKNNFEKVIDNNY